jgi:hypothetical protein
LTPQIWVFPNKGAWFEKEKKRSGVPILLMGVLRHTRAFFFFFQMVSLYQLFKIDKKAPTPNGL